jgi:glycosyltransferase involved in cell wall biosynthesis
VRVGGRAPGAGRRPSRGVRILHVNKFLYRRGGAEAYMLDVAALQSAAGHEVAFFAMDHPENLPNGYERLFPSRVEFEPPPPTIGGKLAGTGRLLWSRTASQGMESMLRVFQPDVVHLHNIYHQLSPSILQPIRRRRIGAVMTLHDYKLACTTYRFLDHGRICEACLPRRLWQPVLKRCNSGSLTASAVSAMELSLHTIGGAYSPIGAFLCPSRFLLEKMRQGRVFPDRLRHLPNFVDTSSIEPKNSVGGGPVYAGRLSFEKGVDVLIEAVAAMPEMTLDIAGDGPARAELESLVTQLAAGARIRFHGRLESEALKELLRGSSVAVVPSRWYENMPLAVLEAFAAGLPVIGTALGGIPELVRPGIDGAIVAPDDPQALGTAIAEFVSEPDRALRMGMAGRQRMQEAFAPEGHLAQLMDAYEEVASGYGSRA